MTRLRLCAVSLQWSASSALQLVYRSMAGASSPMSNWMCESHASRPQRLLHAERHPHTTPRSWGRPCPPSGQTTAEVLQPRPQPQSRSNLSAGQLFMMRLRYRRANQLGLQRLSQRSRTRLTLRFFDGAGAGGPGPRPQAARHVHRQHRAERPAPSGERWRASCCVTVAGLIAVPPAQVYEILDNAVDEVQAGHAAHVTVSCSRTNSKAWVPPGCARHMTGSPARTKDTVAADLTLW